MKTVAIADAKAHLSAYLDECQAEGPIVITRNGKAVAVLLAPADDDLERILLGRNARFQAMLDRSEKSIQEGKGLSETAFWDEVRKRRKGRKASATPRRQINTETDETRRK